jgi:NAD(P)-dependent dehydrogenase (short-subunit alcohol dehydrogenase family)
VSKVLVTGAGGFISSHLVERLAANGAEVRAFVEYDSRGSWSWLDDATPEILDAIEIIAGNIRDSHAVRQAVAGCNTVLHLAALIGIPYSYLAPESYVDTNVTGTLNVVQAAAMAVRSFEVRMPYGVVDISDNEILGLHEKPVSQHFINAGIHVLGRAAPDFLPQNQAFDMPQLFDACRANDMRTLACPIEKHWVDIGQMDGYRRANADFASIL